MKFPKVSFWLLGIALVALFIAACGGAAAPQAAPAQPRSTAGVAIAAVAQERRPGPTPTGQQAIPGGTLIPLAGFDLGHTDPHRNTSVAELSYMVHIYPGILQYDTTTWVDIAPDLATSWEVDSTGKAYTFKV